MDTETQEESPDETGTKPQPPPRELRRPGIQIPGKFAPDINQGGGIQEIKGMVLKQGSRALLSNPYVWAAIGIILLIFVLVWILVGNEAQEELAKQQQQQNQQDPLQTTITCNPPQATVGQIVTCTIHVTYPGTATDVTIVDTITQSMYISSTPNGVYSGGDPKNRTVTWHAAQLNKPTPLTSPIDITVSVVVRATINNVTIPNTYTVTLTGASLGGGAGGSATDNNCNGKYNLTKNRFLPKNFGDPNCTVTKTAIDDRFRSKDPAHASWWFAVMQCESGYNPNAWRDPDLRTHTPDAGGAWGLVQDGSSIIAKPESLYTNSSSRGSVTLQNITQQAGLAGGIWGHGGKYDRGDVTWETQVDYATELLKSRGTGYWACAN
jgi:hypothetical protein